MFKLTTKPGVMPSPRMVAQVQAKVKEAGLPSELAPIFAARMETAEALADDDFQSLLKMLQRMAKSFSVGAADLAKYLEEALGDPETAEGDDAEAEDEAGEDSLGTSMRVFRRVQMLAAAARPVTKVRTGMSRSEGMDRSPARSGQTRMVSMLSAQILSGGRGNSNGNQLKLSDIAMQCARAAGHRPMSISEGVRMAMHSNSDFPTIVAGSLGNAVARRLEQMPPALLRAAHQVNASDYRDAYLLGLSASGMPQEVAETGEIKRVTIDDTGEMKPTPRDFAAIFGISNKAIINDDLGLFNQVAEKMVAGAIERQRRVLLEALLDNGGAGNLMKDGRPVFHADHRNLAETGTALSIESLSAARLALRTQRGSQGELYSFEPYALVVHPYLETAALMYVAQITAASVGDVNPFSQKLEVIVEPGLTDPFAWYLIADPSRHDGLAYAFLDGQSAPDVRSKESWDRLGMEFRLVWPLDARFVSHSSWYKNPGIDPNAPVDPEA